MESRLRSLRQANGLSVTELSEMSGISVTAIHDAENRTIDSYKTNIGVAKALADALYVDLYDLFDPFELSHLGRPPHTGKPIGNVTKITSTDQLCTGCFLIVPHGLTSCERCQDAEIVKITA